MEFKIFLTVFWTVLVAELGDKTQLATMLFASDKEVHKGAVFAGAALALVTASAAAVFFGTFLSNYISPKVMSIIAGAGFILIGILILARGVSGS